MMNLNQNEVKILIITKCTFFLVFFVFWFFSTDAKHTSLPIKIRPNFLMFFAACLVVLPRHAIVLLRRNLRRVLELF